MAEKVCFRLLEEYDFIDGESNIKMFTAIRRYTSFKFKIEI